MVYAEILNATSTAVMISVVLPSSFGPRYKSDERGTVLGVVASCYTSETPK